MSERETRLYPSEKDIHSALAFQKRNAHCVQLSLLAALLLLLGGCASSSPSSSYVVPSRAQPDGVDFSVRNGYELLTSQKPGSAVIVSLRSATPEYIQLFVAVQNTGSNAQMIAPEQIRIQTEGQAPSRTFTAYAPSDVPGVVRSDAYSDALSAAEMMRSTGRVYSTRTSTSVNESSAYGGGRQKDDGPALEEILLQSVELPVGERTGGFVYAPFSMQHERVTVEVPIGEDTHLFRFDHREEAE